MALKYISSTEKGKETTISFEGNAAELAAVAGDYFASRKYKLKKGTPEEAVYERGTYIVRILFGAFVPYYKFNVLVSGGNGNASVTISKAHSGFSGGVIGMAKLNKELKRVIQDLEKADSSLGIFSAN
jgi:hypothetical protein